MRPESERGIALITSLLIMMLMSALMVGFTTLVMSDQRYRVIDRDRAHSFYAAHSGLEKLNVDLWNLFRNNVAPTTSDLDALGTNPPIIPNTQFITTGNAKYGVVLESSPPAAPISTGPYAGLIALKKIYRLDSTAHTADGGETHLTRKVETVAIPVFQFGMFSEVSLSFSAAADFDFGGRVHTNGDLFLAQGGGSTLTMADRVTAVGEIVRQRLSNGVSIDTSGSTGTVKVATAPGTYRNLARTEGSVVDGIGSSANTNWPTISKTYYNYYIRNTATGTRRLDLGVITAGGTPADLARRAEPGEDVTNPGKFSERYFGKVSLRVLLSDTANDIMSLPGVSSAAPVLLDGNWRVAPPVSGVVYGPIDAQHPPIARSIGPLPVNATVQANVATGTNQSITVRVGGVNQVPAYFKVAQATPFTLTVTRGANSYTTTCNGKTQTTFINCTAPVPVGGAPATNSIALPATVSVGAVTTDGVINVSTPLAATWSNANWATMTVTSTLDFAPNTFWVHNAASTVLVTCAGYSNAANQLTNCNVPQQLDANAPIVTAGLSTAGTGTIGGFIKIELQDGSHVWRDVTMEILNWGISGPNINTTGKACGDPTPNAILRFQRLRDNFELAAWPVPAGATCSYAGSTISSDHWPNTLFDPREAVYRDAAAAGGNPLLTGVMHYVTIDVRNLSRWFAGTAPYNGSTGPQAITDRGYSVYFSDRRNNRDSGSRETGEYGFEDVVNPNSGTGAPNGSLDNGEDFNSNGTLETYGQFPSYNGFYNTVPPGALAPLNGAARPTTALRMSEARVNRAILFRRALKLDNGALGNIIAPGFTVASENPVYIEGDFNAAPPPVGFGDPHVSTSVVADAVTLLSSSWNDINSFRSPYAIGGRARSSDTYYRVAIISGKGRIFPQPPGAGATFGTDGGVHSFLRFIEGTGPGNDTIHYRGSMATFYYSRQGQSPFKCCGGVVYGVPTRDYEFDTDFLNPSLLPPLTPLFRDINALGFSQEVRPDR